MLGNSLAQKRSVHRLRKKCYWATVFMHSKKIKPKAESRYRTSAVLELDMSDYGGDLNGSTQH